MIKTFESFTGKIVSDTIKRHNLIRIRQQRLSSMTIDEIIKIIEIKLKKCHEIFIKLDDLSINPIYFRSPKSKIVEKLQSERSKILGDIITMKLDMQDIFGSEIFNNKNYIEIYDKINDEYKLSDKLRHNIRYYYNK